MLRVALLISITLSASAFAWGYEQAGYEDVSRWIIAVGLVWLASSWFKWKWFSAFMVLSALALAGIGVWFRLPFAWLFSGAVYALFAWILSDFSERIKVLPAREDIAGKTRRLILRFTLLASVAFGIITAALWLRRELSGDWGVFLSLTVLTGLLQILGWRRR